MKALGYRVSPFEVEAALMQHPAIAEVACAEVRVRADVSVIGAFIVTKDGLNPSAEEIERFAARSGWRPTSARARSCSCRPCAHRQRQAHALRPEAAVACCASVVDARADA